MELQMPTQEGTGPLSVGAGGIGFSTPLLWGEGPGMGRGKTHT